MVGNIYINGAIGHWEDSQSVSLMDIVKQVKAQPEATEFNVYINSEGGFVDIGFDIYNYLKNLGKPVNTIGNGMVASIATIIFMAGVNRTIRPNTQFMIHLPWTEAVGNADELEDYAKELRNAEKQLISFYTKELGLTEEVIQPLMRDESWLTLDQLQTLGFITTAPVPVAAKAKLNINKQDTKMSDTKTEAAVNGFIATLLAKFGHKSKVVNAVSAAKVVNKLVQDATGVELDFTELADGDAIVVGATAMAAGVPAEGEYTLPDGTVYTFVAGELTEIVLPADAISPEEAAALKAENEAFKSEIETLKAENAASAKLVDEIKTEVVNLKRAITTGGAPAGKVDGKKPATETDPTNRFAGAAARVKAGKK